MHIRDTRHMKPIILTCLSIVAILTSSGLALPVDGRVELVLRDASWRSDDRSATGDVTLYLNRSGGRWQPAIAVDARHQSVATHDGYVVSAESVDGRHEMLLRVRFRRDK